jgi:hypothetical protein
MTYQLSNPQTMQITRRDTLKRDGNGHLYPCAGIDVRDGQRTHFAQIILFGKTQEEADQLAARTLNALTHAEAATISTQTDAPTPAKVAVDHDHTNCTRATQKRSVIINILSAWHFDFPEEDARRLVTDHIRIFHSSLSPALETAELIIMAAATNGEIRVDCLIEQKPATKFCLLQHDVSLNGRTLTGHPETMSATQQSETHAPITRRVERRNIATLYSLTGMYMYDLNPDRKQFFCETHASWELWDETELLARVRRWPKTRIGFVIPKDSGKRSRKPNSK